MENFQERWQDLAWRAQVNEWTRRKLAKKNIHMLGDLQETQLRPWSIVLHTMTDAGKIYFKVPPPDFAYEAPLTEKLSQWFPQAIPQILALEPASGWWLARDGGEPIRAHLKATRDLSEWMQAAGLYVQLQMEVSSHVDEMLALGVPDRRPRALPGLYENVLNDTPILRIDLEKGITSQEYADLRAMTPLLAQWCQELQDRSIPNSLHHGDLNSGNVLKHDGQYAFVDWGDASVGHPFYSIRTPLVSVEIVLDLPENDPSTAPLRDAYLNAWAKYGSREDILSTYRLAQRLSELVTCFAWYGSISKMPVPERGAYEHIVPSQLQAFLHADLGKYPYI